MCKFCALCAHTRSYVSGAPMSPSSSEHCIVQSRKTGNINNSREWNRDLKKRSIIIVSFIYFPTERMSNWEKGSSIDSETFPLLFSVFSLQQQAPVLWALEMEGQKEICRKKYPVVVGKLSKVMSNHDPKDPEKVYANNNHHCITLTSLLNCQKTTARWGWMNAYKYMRGVLNGTSTKDIRDSRKDLPFIPPFLHTVDICMKHLVRYKKCTRIAWTSALPIYFRRLFLPDVATLFTFPCQQQQHHRNNNKITVCEA